MPEVELKPEKQKRVKKAKLSFVNVNGEEIVVGKPNRVLKQALIHHIGIQTVDDKPIVTYDVQNPLGTELLQPSEQSPICTNCGLYEHKAKHPFMAYSGSDTPLVTVITDSVSAKEDMINEMAGDGPAGFFRKFIEAHEKETGVSVKDVRFAAITRCASRIKGKDVNFASKGSGCRLFLVQDLILHPPKVIIAVGTQVLGLLSHKSNAQDWGGKILTWRGWPDDWLTDTSFMLPKPEPEPGKINLVGHPLFGPPPGPEARRLLYPIQTMRLIRASQNQQLLERWADQILNGLRLSIKDTAPLNFNLPHYRILLDAEAVADELSFIISHPGMVVAYDTETNGLRPWMAGQRIVFMMFRYDHPVTGEKVAFGFPWDYPESELVNDVPDLAPFVYEALCVSLITGHNLTFDALFTAVTLGNPDECPILTERYEISPEWHASKEKFYAAVDEHGRVRPEWSRAQRRLEALADACRYDTMHMTYCFLQQRGSLGLELLAYKYAPQLAGYEEEMVLLIELMSDTLSPDSIDPVTKRPGHYALCPKDKWETHLKPYVMGDVEVAHIAREAIQKKLDNSKVYRFPLANPNRPGSFRYFQPPNRAWIYDKILSPAARLLTKIMGRGMHVDEKVLTTLEQEMPKDVKKLREEIARMTPDVEEWCREQETVDAHRTDPDKKWELDLEKKDQIKAILFDTMRLRPKRLTKAGKRLFGDEPGLWTEKIQDWLRSSMPDISDKLLKDETEQTRLKYAAIDKFTLNSMAVDHPEVRPLQEYRKLYKLYTTYVRPMRNCMHEDVDKKERTATWHYCPDGMVHAQFTLTGTRGGRISSRSPNLQNLARRGDVKKMYTSRFKQSGCLYGADMSQVELRLLAAACGDPTMVDAYAKGLDLHSLTASKIYKIPYEHFQKDYFKWLQDQKRDKEAKELEMKRGVGKTSNFLTGYGGGAFGLQNTLANNQVYLPIEECERVIDSFFDAYPTLKDHMAWYKKFIMDTGAAVSIFGRLRVFDEVGSEDKEAVAKAMRAGYNHLIQSTASDMMLISMVTIETLMREANLESILVSTVHDSLLIDALRSELPQIHEISDYVLNNLPEVFKVHFGEDYDASWMSLVKFTGDSDVGLNYLEMRGIGPNPDWDKLLAA